MRVEAVISDFGGVLTSPLSGAFAAFQDESGIPLAELGTALATLGAARGANPLFDLETGRLSENEFLAGLAAQLGRQLGRTVDLTGFGERYFANLTPNEPLIAYLRELGERGYKLAICTNNVREWEARWRAMLPVEEIFDVVVDSAFVGSRKPDPEIYRADPGTAGRGRRGRSADRRSRGQLRGRPGTGHSRCLVSEH